MIEGREKVVTKLVGATSEVSLARLLDDADVPLENSVYVYLLNHSTTMILKFSLFGFVGTLLIVSFFVQLSPPPAEHVRRASLFSMVESVNGGTRLSRRRAPTRNPPSFQG